MPMETSVRSESKRGHNQVELETAAWEGCRGGHCFQVLHFLKSQCVQKFGKK